MIKAIYNRELNGRFTPQEQRLIGGHIEDKFFTQKKSSYTSVKLQDIQTKSVFAVAFSHDGTLVASTHADHTIRVLFYEPFGLTHTLRGHARSPVSLQFHPKNRFILASGCLSGQVFLWNLQSMMGTKMHQLCPFSHQPTTHEIMHSVMHLPIGSIAFHPNGRHLVASRCKQLTMWDIEASEFSQPVHTVFTEHETERIRAVLFDPFGRYMVTAIRRVVPLPPSPDALPEVKVETWTPKRPKTGRFSKLSTFKDAFNKLIYAGQKRSYSTANANNTEPDGEDAVGSSTRTNSSSSFPSLESSSSAASPAAGHHSPQPRLDPSTVQQATQTPHSLPPVQDASSTNAATNATTASSSPTTTSSPTTAISGATTATSGAATPGATTTHSHSLLDLPGRGVQRGEHADSDPVEVRLQNRSLCTNCQAGAFNKNVVQIWDFEEETLPNIQDAESNVITKSAIMVTNVNLQVSPDGTFVCLVEKEEISGGATLFITVYSLSPDTFKQCLMKTTVKYIPMCISITPYNQYIVAFARHTDGQENHAGMIITYEIPKKRYSEKQRMTRSMTKPPSSAPKFNQISIHDEMPINIARFGQLPWQGTVIGTCSGKLYLMRVASRHVHIPDTSSQPPT